MINWPVGRLPKKNAFVLASTDHGPMIINRFDYNVAPNGGTYGVGFNLLNTSSFDPAEINTMLSILALQRTLRGDGVVMLDGGANIGVHSLSAGRLMQGWGSVIAVEAQERIFYATAGNVALNNLFNVRVLWCALSDNVESIEIPVVNYTQPASFGSLELQPTETSEFIGQTPLLQTQSVDAITVDSLNINRLDFFKLDVEAMEVRVLRGARNTIAQCKPVIHLEQLKSDRSELDKIFAEHEYVTFELGPNLLGIHKDDEILSHISVA